MENKVQYDGIAKTLHWLIAVLVILLLLAGGGLEDLPVEEKTQVVMGHSGLGTLVLLLMMIRLAWRFTHRPPQPVAMAAWQLKVSVIVHRLFYVLVILQPVFGIGQAMFVDYSVVAFGVIDYSALAISSESMAKIFHVAHGTNATLLMLLVLLHAGGALAHHFYHKDMVLRRMLPYGRVPKE